MIAAVTGGSGHLGANLVRALLNRGAQVRVLVRKDTRAFEGLEVERCVGDLADEDSLKTVLSGADHVFHLAALVATKNETHEECQAVNVQGTKKMVTAALQAGVKRLVYVSSIHALEQLPLHTTLDEKRPLALDIHALPYDRSKAGAEIEILKGVQHGLPAVIVNPSAIIGPFDFKPSALGLVILKLMANKMPVLIEGGFDFVDARDVAQGIISAANQGRIGERYILSGAWHRFKTLAQMVAKSSSSKVPRVSIPLPLAAAFTPLVAFISNQLKVDPLLTTVAIRNLKESHQGISSEKARLELNYGTRQLEETVADTVHWFKERFKS